MELTEVKAKKQIKILQISKSFHCVSDYELNLQIEINDKMIGIYLFKILLLLYHKIIYNIGSYSADKDSLNIMIS